MVVENPQDLLKKLEYVSLVSKVCTEMESHTGNGDNVPQKEIEAEAKEKYGGDRDRKIHGEDGHRGRDRKGMRDLRHSGGGEVELYKVYKGRVSQSHTATRVHCRAVTSVAQSPPSSSHLCRAVTSFDQSPPSSSQFRRAVTSFDQHHSASLSPTLPIACSVEALKVPSSFQSS
ncbi:hypothetical protein HN51_014953, partial [Arachis hypogaea]